MLSRVTETLHATFVLFTIAKIFTDGLYVQYTINGNRRICLPYSNCEPGHEIQPCAREYTTDICTSCTNGLVQPDLISSSLKGNHNETNCFAPVSKCDANEIKYSRSKKTAFCDALRGCECDTTKCYYGDPCLCEHKKTECEGGKYLNKTGGCEDCPEGLEKAGKGCGPCRRTKYIGVREFIDVDEVKTSSKTTNTLSETPSTSLPTTSQMPVDFDRSVKIEKPNNEIMTIIIVVLSVALVTLLVVVVWILIRKRCNRICRSKKRLHPNYLDTMDMMKTAQENIPLNPIENVEIPEITNILKTTGNEKPTAAFSDNHSSEMPTQHVTNTSKLPCENSWDCTDTMETKQEHTSLKKVVDDDITEVKNTLNTLEGGEKAAAQSVNQYVVMQRTLSASGPREIDDEHNSKTRANDRCISEPSTPNMPCENYWNCTDQMSSITEEISSAIEYYPFTLQHCSNSSSDDKDDGILDTFLKV